MMQNSSLHLLEVVDILLSEREVFWPVFQPHDSPAHQDPNHIRLGILHQNRNLHDNKGRPAG